MSLHDDMSDTVSALYAAAAGEVEWSAALDRMLESTGFEGATLYAFDRATRAAASPNRPPILRGLWHRFEPELQREYEAEVCRIDPRRAWMIERPRQRIRYDGLHTTDAEMDRDPAYDWLERRGGMRYYIGGQSEPDAPFGVTVNLHRRRASGHAQPDEIRIFGMLLGHLQRAIEVERRLLLPTRDAGHLELLERNPTGIVLLSTSGTVLFANAAARRMAAASDSFTLATGGLHALRPRDDDALQRLILQAVRTSGGQGLSSGGAIKLPRRSGKQGYVAIVAPLARRMSLLRHLMPAACVLITDPDAPPARSEAALRQLYGLTSSEARVAECLMRGDTVEHAAQALRITAGTARGYLASIFRKTETNRQTELVRLLLAPPWWMLRDAEPRERQ